MDGSFVHAGPTELVGRCGFGQIRPHAPPPSSQRELRQWSADSPVSETGDRPLYCALPGTASARDAVRRNRCVPVRADHQSLLGKPPEARLGRAARKAQSPGDPGRRCLGVRAYVGKNSPITSEATLELVLNEEAGGAHAETEDSSQGSPVSGHLGCCGVQEAKDEEGGSSKTERAEKFRG